MIGTKKWYESKIFWIGASQVVYGSAMMVAEFIEAGQFNPVSIATFLIGLMTVVFRVFFTDTVLVA